MTNHPACYTVLKQQTAEQATVLVIRTKYSLEPHGTISWIAMGK